MEKFLYDTVSNYLRNHHIKNQDDKMGYIYRVCIKTARYKNMFIQDVPTF